MVSFWPGRGIEVTGEWSENKKMRWDISMIFASIYLTHLVSFLMTSASWNVVTEECVSTRLDSASVSRGSGEALARYLRTYLAVKRKNNKCVPVFFTLERNMVYIFIFYIDKWHRSFISPPK